MKKGIYLVANLKSQDLCENLIYSIRNTGCTLPIRVIHFGGKKISSQFILSQVEYLEIDSVQTEAKDFINNLRTVLNECPMGFLYRFVAWFGDWDEFIYSDNDIVALTNWEKLFEFMPGYDLVHADEEYTTRGRFNYHKPEEIKRIFGNDSLTTAITAGHFVSRRNDKLVADMNKAVEWFKQNPAIPMKHDQSLLHIASLIGKWKVLNLCKPPNNWLSSWAGDYKNSLQLIHSIQGNNVRNISHLHYSGGYPEGNRPIEELIFSSIGYKKRLKKLALISNLHLLGLPFFQFQTHRVKRLIKYLTRKR